MYFQRFYKVIVFHNLFCLGNPHIELLLCKWRLLVTSSAISLEESVDYFMDFRMARVLRLGIQIKIR